MPHYVLSSANAGLIVTNLAPGVFSTLDGLPLGTVGGTATGELGLKVIPISSPSGDEYEDVAASQTGQVLGATGAVGDYLAFIDIIPETTAAGTVALLDGAISRNIFVTGTLSNLQPFSVAIYAKSVSGAWSVTTGANVHVFATGNFT